MTSLTAAQSFYFIAISYVSTAAGQYLPTHPSLLRPTAASSPQNALMTGRVFDRLRGSFSVRRELSSTKDRVLDC